MFFVNATTQGGGSNIERENLWKFTNIDHDGIFDSVEFISDFVSCQTSDSLFVRTLGTSSILQVINNEQWTESDLSPLPAHNTLGTELLPVNPAVVQGRLYGLGSDCDNPLNSNDPLSFDINASFWGYFYNATENITLWHDGDNGASRENAFNRHNTLEGGNGADLQINSSSFKTWDILISNTRFLFVNFETERIFLTNDSTEFDDPTGDAIIDYDMAYDLRDNLVRGLTANGVTHSIFLDTDKTLQERLDFEDLETAPCLDPSNEFIIPQSTDPVSSTPSIVHCFDLRDNHGDQDFYGAFKLVNASCPNSLGCDGGLGNNAWDVGLLLSFVSPSNFEVTFKSIIPTNPIKGDDVRVNFITTKNATGTVQYRIADADANLSNLSVFSQWFRVNTTGNLTSHSPIIEDVAEDKFFQFFVFAEDNDGNLAVDNNTDNFYNFTVGARGVFKGNQTAGIVNITSTIGNLLGIGFDFVYVYGLILLVMITSFGWRFGGQMMGLGIFFTLVFGFSLFGLLPSFLLLPFVILLTLILSKVVLKFFTN